MVLNFFSYRFGSFLTEIAAFALEPEAHRKWRFRALPSLLVSTFLSQRHRYLLEYRFLMLVQGYIHQHFEFHPCEPIDLLLA